MEAAGRVVGARKRNLGRVVEADMMIRFCACTIVWGMVELSGASTRGEETCGTRQLRYSKVIENKNVRAGKRNIYLFFLLISFGNEVRRSLCHGKSELVQPSAIYF